MFFNEKFNEISMIKSKEKMNNNINIKKKVK